MFSCLMPHFSQHKVAHADEANTPEVVPQQACQRVCGRCHVAIVNLQASTRDDDDKDHEDAT